MQLNDVGRENAYNYELQYSRMFDEHITIRCGDVLHGACIYNSMERTEVTPGGVSSQQEMCTSFILVYPASCGTPHTSFILILFIVNPIQETRSIKHPCMCFNSSSGLSEASGIMYQSLSL
jgi:hypothetical protein